MNTNSIKSISDLDSLEVNSVYVFTNGDLASAIEIENFILYRFKFNTGGRHVHLYDNKESTRKEKYKFLVETECSLTTKVKNNLETIKKLILFEVKQNFLLPFFSVVIIY